MSTQNEVSASKQEKEAERMRSYPAAILLKFEMRPERLISVGKLDYIFGGAPKNNSFSLACTLPSDIITMNFQSTRKYRTI